MVYLVYACIYIALVSIDNITSLIINYLMYEVVMVCCMCVRIFPQSVTIIIKCCN